MSGQFRFYKLLFFILIPLLFAFNKGYSDDLYWINGSGSWNDPSHWSTESGGKPGNVIPTQFDNVIFDENSFSGSGQYVLIDGEVSCDNFIWKKTPYNPVLKSRQFLLKKLTFSSLSVHGDFIIKDQIKNEYHGNIIFKGEQKSNVVQVQVPLHSDVIYEGANSEWTLTGDLETSGDIYLKKGKLNTNNKNVTCDEFVSAGTSERTLNLTDSKINVEKWDVRETQNLQYNQGSSVILLQSNVNQRNFKMADDLGFRLSSGNIQTDAIFGIDSINIDSADCFGTSTGSMTVYVSGGTADYTYTLREEDNSGTIVGQQTTSNQSYQFTGLAAGVYYVHVEENEGDINTASNQIVEEPDQLQVTNIEVVKGLSCHNSSDASFKAIPDGGTPPYGYAWYKYNSSTDTYESIGQYTQTVTNVGQGIFKVEMSDANACDSVNTQIVFLPGHDSIPPEITIDNISSTNTCDGESNGTISISASGGTGTIQYYLVKTSDGSTIPSSGYDADGNFSGLEADTYETYAIDDNGCTQQGSDVTIGTTPKPEAFAGNNTSICSDNNYQTTTATADHYTSLQWTTTGNGSFSDPNALNTTYNHAPSDVGTTVTLTLTAFGQGNCADSSHSMNLTINAQPAVNAGSNSPVCEGEDINLTESGGDASSWSWTGPDGFTSNQQNPVISNATPVNSGRYYVTVTAANGCTNTGSVDVTVNSTPDVNATSNSPVCENSDINLNENGGDATSWSWTGPNGFTSNQQSPTISNATPANDGRYYVTITDANGCNNIDSVDVTVYAAPAVNAGSNSPICEGEDINLTENGGDATSWSWTGPDGFTSSQQNPTISNAVPTNSGMYYVTVSDGNGCTNIDSVSVTVNATPTVNAGSNSPVCEGEDLNLTENGGDATSWSWTGPNGFTSNQQNPTISNATPVNSGRYYVTVTDGIGCTNTDSVDVTVNPTPAVNATSNSPVCEEGNINLNENGGDATSWSWTGPNGFTSNQQSPTISNAAPANDGRYYVTITDANGCSNIDSVDVTVYAAPAVNAGSNSPICEGEDINLSETGGDASSWSWTGPDGFTSNQQNPTISNATSANSGMYYVTASDANGCTNIDSVNVTVNATPTVNAGSNSPLCEGEDLNLTETGGDASSWSWTGPDGFTSNQQNPTINNATPANSGRYYVTINDANGCSNIDSVDVTINATPNVVAGSNSPVCEGEEINLTETGGDATSWSWTGPNGFSSNQQNPTISNATLAADGMYYVTVSDGIGCSNIDSVDVSITPAPTADAGQDSVSICYNDAYLLSDATATNYSSIEWTTSGDGVFDNDNALNPEYTPGPSDKSNGSVWLYLTAGGNGPCNDAVDSIKIIIPPQLEVNIGRPHPFLIDSNSTTISVQIAIGDHDYVQDLSYYLVANDSLKVELKKSPNEVICNFTDTVNLTFTTEETDTLDICGTTNLFGTYGATGDWSRLHGADPSNGAWRVEVVDNQSWAGSDGFIRSASIRFTDLNSQGDTSTVTYQSDDANIAIKEYSGSGPYATTNYSIPMNLETSCFDGCDATAIATITGGTEPYSTIEWSDVSDFSNILFTSDTVDLCAGVYYVRVTDALGCVAIDSVTVNQPPEIIIDSLDIISVTDLNGCYGDSIAEVHDSAYGGTGTLFYTLIKDPSGTADTIGTNTTGDFINLTGGEYLLEVYDQNFCLKDTLFTIDQPDPIQITSETFVPLSGPGASDGSIDIDATGGTPPLSYLLYQFTSTDTTGVDTTNNGEFTGLSEGDYYVIVTDVNGCDSVKSSDIHIGPLEILFTVDSVSCALDSNGRIMAYARGGFAPYRFEWTNFAGDTLKVTENTYSDRDTLSNLTGGYYVLNVIDSTGNNERDTAFVYEPNPLQFVSIQPDTLSSEGASDGSVNIITAGGNDTIYFEIDNINDAFPALMDTALSVNDTATTTISGLSKGVYEIIAYDEKGCGYITDTVNIIHYELSMDKQDIACHGQTNGLAIAIVDGGTPPFEYNWSTASPRTDTLRRDTLTNVAAGWHYVTVTDKYGFELTDSVEVIEPAPINTTLADTLMVNCFGSFGEAIVSISGGQSPYSVTWYDAGSMDSVETGDTAYLAAGFYYVRVDDSAGCFTMDSIYVSQPDEIEILKDFITLDLSYPYGITVRGTGGNDSLIYRLYTPSDTIAPTSAYLSGDTTVGVFTGLESASYTVIATDSLGCDPDTLVISVPMEIRMDTVRKISCPGSGDGAVAVNVLQGNPEFTYEWSKVDTVNNNRVLTPVESRVSPEYSDTITGLSQGWYIVTVTDYYDITVIDSIYLDEAPPIQLSSTVTQAYCDSNLTPLGNDIGSIVVDVTGGTPYTDGDYAISWNGTSPVKGRDSIGDLQAGLYDVVVYDSLGCTYTDVIEIQSNPNYRIQVSLEAPIDTVCLNSRVKLHPETITRVDSLYWSPMEEDYYSINDMDTITDEPFRDTTYTLYVKNSHCYTTISKIVDMYPVLDISIDENDEEIDNTLAFLENVNEVDLTGSVVNSENIADSAISYSWGPGSYFVSTTGLQSTLSIEALRDNDIAKQRVWLVATIDHTNETCVETDSIMVNVVPNVTPTDAFSPNGDGINDVWKIKDANNYENLEVIIFNRWGVEVFRRKPYSNDEGTAWKGRNNNGKELPSGTYYYIINSHEKGVDILSGTVTIIR